MTVCFNVGDGEEIFACREAVVGWLHEGYHDDVVVEYSADLSKSVIEDRMDLVRSILPWNMAYRGDHTVWVDAPHDQLAQLHAVLGILRGSEVDYEHYMYDAWVLKALVKAGVHTSEGGGLPWNGVHSFIMAKVPPLDFYQAALEFLPLIREDNTLLFCPVPGRTSVFLMRPEELAETARELERCMHCGTPVKMRWGGLGGPLGSTKIMWGDTCDCSHFTTKPLGRVNLWTHMPVFYRDGRVPSVLCKSVLLLNTLFNQRGE